MLLWFFLSDLYIYIYCPNIASEKWVFIVVHHRKKTPNYLINYTERIFLCIYVFLPFKWNNFCINYVFFFFFLLSLFSWGSFCIIIIIETTFSILKWPLNVMAPGDLLLYNFKNFQSYCFCKGNACFRYSSETIKDRDFGPLLMSCVYLDGIQIYSGRIRPFSLFFVPLSFWIPPPHKKKLPTFDIFVRVTSDYLE